MAKIVDKIQKIVDEKDPKKDLGNVKQGQPVNFRYKNPNVPSDIPDKKEKKETPVTWRKHWFQYNYGKIHEPHPKDYSFNRSIVTTNNIVSNNGNFRDTGLLQDYNALYKATVSIDKKKNLFLNIVAPDAGIVIYTKKLGESGLKQHYSSGSTSFYPTKGGEHVIHFPTAGDYIIEIFYYRQEAGGYIEVDGNLGSFISSHTRTGVRSVKPAITTSSATAYNDNTYIGTVESKFIDGANGPQLANIITWRRNPSDPYADGSVNSVEDITGYGLYRVDMYDTGLLVTSGWGTDGFCVNGNYVELFPIASKIRMVNPDTGNSYIVSGVVYDVDKTVVITSGTAFTNSANDKIFLEVYTHIQDFTNRLINVPVISGIDNNVVAGKTYKYAIDVFDSFGDRSEKSNVISVVAGDFTPPGLVSNVQATGAFKAVKLTWTNPSDTDIKGIHIWDTANPDPNTDSPVATILKGSKNTLPTSFMVTQDSNGVLSDDTLYSFYISTFDWAGNETLSSIPGATATTNVDFKTSQTGERVEVDTNNNQFRYYDNNNNAIVKIGGGAIGGGFYNGIQLESGVIYMSEIDADKTAELWQHTKQFLMTYDLYADIQPAQPMMQLVMTDNNYPKLTGSRILFETSVNNDEWFAAYHRGKIYVEKDFLIGGAYRVYNTSNQSATPDHEFKNNSGNIVARITDTGVISGSDLITNNPAKSRFMWTFAKDGFLTSNGYTKMHGINSAHWPVTSAGTVTKIVAYNVDIPESNTATGNVAFNALDRISVYALWDAANQAWTLEVRKNTVATGLSTTVGSVALPASPSDFIGISIEIEI